MEINSEINKIFGTEMANLFSNKISEEEIDNMAQKAWKTITTPTDSYGYRKEPDIERYIREKVMDRLYEKIQTILKEPIAEETLEKKAREMIEKARQLGEEIIIKDIAKNIANDVLSIYGRREDIINEVLRQVHIEKENEKRY